MIGTRRVFSSIGMPGLRSRSRRSARIAGTWFAACCACGSAADTVRAQTPSPLAEWQYSAGVPLAKVLAPAQQPVWQIDTGAAVDLRPSYPGASAYRVRIGPSIDIRYRDLFFASTGEGIGVNVLRGPNWRVAISAGYDLGRRAADDLDHLRGMPNIGAAALVRLAADYVITKPFPWVARVAVRRDIGGASGWRGDLSAYLPLPGSNERFFWFAGPSVTFADARYMNAWFGVSDAQARAGERRGYAPSAGLRSVAFGTTAVWFVDKHWFVTAAGAVEQLVGAAARSPLVTRSTQAVVDVSISYRF
nr:MULTISPECIES: MipA/OmpV family protein [unclassified Burkholderia]